MVRSLFATLCLCPSDEEDPAFGVPEDPATELLAVPNPNLPRELELGIAAGFDDALDEMDGREALAILALLDAEPATVGSGLVNFVPETGVDGPTPFQTFLTKFFAEDKNPNRDVGALTTSG